MNEKTLGIVALTLLGVMLATRFEPVRQFVTGGNKYFN